MATDLEMMRAFAARRADDAAADARRHVDALRAALPALVAALRTLGATRVVLFGSLASGRAGAASDIDLAVEGLPSSAYLDALGALESVLPTPVDLVRLEDASTALAARIARDGVVLLG